MRKSMTTRANQRQSEGNTISLIGGIGYEYYLEVPG